MNTLLNQIKSWAIFLVMALITLNAMDFFKFDFWVKYPHVTAIILGLVLKTISDLIVLIFFNDDKI